MRNLKKYVPKKMAGEEYDSIVFSNMFSHFDLGVKLLLLFLTFDELLVFWDKMGSIVMSQVRKLSK